MTKRHVRLAAPALVMALTAACSSGDDTGTGTTDSTAPSEGRVTLRIPANTQSGGYPQPNAAIRGPGRLITTYINDQAVDTPGCPPCGVTGNKRHLHSGNANPAN